MAFGWSAITCLRFQMDAIEDNGGRDLSYALEVDDKKACWTVIVQLVRKDDIKIGKSGKKYQGYVFADINGTLVSVVSSNSVLKHLTGYCGLTLDTLYQMLLSKFACQILKSANPVTRGHFQAELL